MLLGQLRGLLEISRRWGLSRSFLEGEKAMILNMDVKRVLDSSRVVIWLVQDV